MLALEHTLLTVILFPRGVPGKEKAIVQVNFSEH